MSDIEETEEKPYKIRVVGVGGVGKSALSIQFIKSEFSEEYIPTIEESYMKEVEVDGQSVKLDILDTAGQEEYSALRDTYMRGGEGFLLVYSVTEKQSLQDLEEFYSQILMVKNAENADHIPMVVCGNKSDLESEREIGFNVGNDKAHNIWKIPFFETSAKENKNVEKSFITLAEVIQKERERKEADNAELGSNTKDKDGTQKCCIIL